MLENHRVKKKNQRKPGGLSQFQEPEVVAGTGSTGSNLLSQRTRSFWGKTGRSTRISNQIWAAAGANPSRQRLFDIPPEGHGFLRPQIIPSQRDIIFPIAIRLYASSRDLVEESAVPPKDT